MRPCWRKPVHEVKAPSSAAAPSTHGVREFLRLPLPAIGLGIVVLAIGFWPEALAAYRTWSTSTAYSHCFFVVPIALYLAWDRRAALADIPIAPFPYALALILPISIAWLGAERLGIMEGRQLSALALLEVLFLVVLGWRMFYALLAPLLYLFFLVPFGAFLTGSLQDFTAVFIDVGLSVIGIPHVSDGYVIDIPEGRYYVAEACAGLRFLIASVAFGALYAVLIYRSAWRRIGFMAASIVIPIFANGFRALGITVLGHLLGSAEAAAADHLLYGWLFFSIVILLLVLAGLPFREDWAVRPAAPRTVTTTGGIRASLTAAGLYGSLALTGPAVSTWLDRAGRVAPASLAANLITPLGCYQGRQTAPTVDGMRSITTSTHFVCPQGPLTIVIQVLSPRASASSIVTARRLLGGEIGSDDDEITISDLIVPGYGPAWRLVATSSPPRVTALQLWIGGQPAPGGLAGRLLMARNSILGADGGPVLVAIFTQTSRPLGSQSELDQARAFISTFLAVQTDLVGQIALRNHS